MQVRTVRILGQNFTECAAEFKKLASNQTADLAFCFGNEQAISQLSEHQDLGQIAKNWLAGTSRLSCADQDGLNNKTTHNATLLLITDSKGHYGVGSAELIGDIKQQAAAALQQAMNAAGKSHELPTLIWCLQAAGCEELVLAGLQELVGTEVPIFGGSTADDDISGSRLQFDGHTLSKHNVLIAVLYPSVPTDSFFSTQIKELLSSFTGFVANTLVQVETRQLITERDQLLQRQQRIEQSLLQQEKMASLGQLAAGVAHELNNPLGFIYSNLNTLSVYLDDLRKVLKQQPALVINLPNIDVDFLLDDGRDLIEESLEGARRARDIINNLRSYAHPDDKTTCVMPLNQLLDSAVKIARTQIKHNSVINLKLSPESPTVIVNANQLNQVILNLIINANQAVADGQGRITISSGTIADHCYFDVTDNGCGIAPEVQAKIFEPFFTTKDVGKGTGLGLSLSKAIVDQHRGQIALQHSSPNGSIFRVTLPAVLT